MKPVPAPYMFGDHPLIERHETVVGVTSAIVASLINLGWIYTTSRLRLGSFVWGTAINATPLRSRGDSFFAYKHSHRSSSSVEMKLAQCGGPTLGLYEWVHPTGATELRPL